MQDVYDVVDPPGEETAGAVCCCVLLSGRMALKSHLNAAAQTAVPGDLAC